MNVRILTDAHSLPPSKVDPGKLSSQLPIFTYRALIVTRLENYRAVLLHMQYPEWEQKRPHSLRNTTGITWVCQTLVGVCQTLVGGVTSEMLDNRQ